MSGSYHIFLLRLKPDLSAYDAATEKIDHGRHNAAEVYRLGELLLHLDPANRHADAGVLIQRGDHKWRLVAHEGVLRLHKSSSSFDDFWTATPGQNLSTLPPFRGQEEESTASTNSPVRVIKFEKKSTPLKQTLGIIGMALVALVCMAIAIRFGLPRKRLSDLPAGVTVVSSPAEREQIFRTVAGSYATGSTPGNSVVIITPQGEVTLSSIGKDGKPTTPRVREIARAGRRGATPCVITSFGVIAATEPPKIVNVGAYPWKAGPS